ncbi:hypothetical protein PMI41_03173 [Phyllobacterium sp. YR531]|nr:hypothetical protein PMI41_03173 [Phyllobacterium sp. YR531]
MTPAFVVWSISFASGPNALLPGIPGQDLRGISDAAIAPIQVVFEADMTLSGYSLLGSDEHPFALY